VSCGSYLVKSDKQALFITFVLQLFFLALISLTISLSGHRDRLLLTSAEAQTLRAYLLDKFRPSLRETEPGKLRGWHSGLDSASAHVVHINYIVLRPVRAFLLALERRRLDDYPNNK